MNRDTSDVSIGQGQPAAFASGHQPVRLMRTAFIGRHLSRCRRFCQGSRPGGVAELRLRDDAFYAPAFSVVSLERAMSGAWWLEFRRAMLAPCRGRIEVSGAAGRTGLGRWRRFRVAENRLAASLHDPLVGHNKKKVDDGHEDNEVDDRRDEVTYIEEGGIATTREQLPAKPLRILATLRRGNRRPDDVGGEFLDKMLERQGDDKSDGGNDDVATHQKVSEAFQHVPAP